MYKTYVQELTFPTPSNFSKIKDTSFSEFWAWLTGERELCRCPTSFFLSSPGTFD